MSQMFDERVEKAVDILWLHMQFDKGFEARNLLKEAAEEGDADACYFLARCYAGSRFVHSSFGLEEDKELWENYLNQSIENGSLVGMFGASSFMLDGYGFCPRGDVIQPPYHSAKEVWDEVNRLAENGELFCQILLADAYYHGDLTDYFGIDDIGEWDDELKMAPIYENLIAHDVMTGIDNYIKAVRAGLGNNLPDKKKAHQLEQIAADHDMPGYQMIVGEYLEDIDPDKAEEYYKHALRLHDMAAYYSLGRLHSFHGKGTKDLQKAKYYFEMGLEANPESAGCNNRLGEIYFYGGDGIEVDYHKAVEYFLKASQNGNHGACAMLGTCYLKGLGTEVDYAKAKKELERLSPPNPLLAIGLGEIYAYGLGVPADIEKGIRLWQKYPDHPRVKENMKNFKKGLFGGWKRIK